jgi:hypothetical protein
MAKKIPGMAGRKGMRTRKSIVRTASKSMEKKTITQAKAVYDNPLLVLPSYTDSDSSRGFKKIRKQLEKLHSFKEDTKRLEKIANKRNYVGAVAGTMLIAHAAKAPFLAAATLPTGTVTYAQRGNASKEHLIAAQNFNDPFLRLLGIKDIALKYNLHVYSWDNGFISTGTDKNPPDEFINYVLNEINLSLHNSVATCPHIKPGDIKEKKVISEPYLRIAWDSADIIIGICKHCTQKSKNSLFSITKFLIEPKIADDFFISIIGQIIKNEDENTETEYFIDDYVTGSLTDRQIIDKNMEKRKEDLQQSDEKLFVLNDVSYGNDREKFISALRPNDAEHAALSFMLEKIKDPIIISDATPNTVLQILWDDHAKDFLSSIIHDESIISELLSLNDNPSTILETAFTYTHRKKILDKLPEYSSLPKLAAFTDRIARLYKTQTKERVLTELKKTPDTTKAKAVTYGFLLSLGKARDMKWKFSQVEIESGEFLRPYIDTLLDSSPETYHDALQQVINASGSSENLQKFKI